MTAVLSIIMKLVSKSTEALSFSGKSSAKMSTEYHYIPVPTQA